MARPDDGVTHMWHGPCRHCGARKIARPRRLCCACYNDDAIRPLYPSQSKFAPKVAKGEREPTLAELEATIAQRMQNLPAWWAAETKRFRRCEGKD
jgi:hypothetical protein